MSLARRKNGSQLQLPRQSCDVPQAGDADCTQAGLHGAQDGVTGRHGLHLLDGGQHGTQLGVGQGQSGGQGRYGGQGVHAGTQGMLTLGGRDGSAGKLS